MPIVNTDLLFKLSTKSGAAGNTLTSTPADSLGKYISTSQLSGTPLNNFFDDISGAENAASDVEYRCLFIHNSHATLTLSTAAIWLQGGDPAGGADIAIGVDPAAASAIGSASAQAAEIADEGSAPAGVSFSAPTTFGTGIAIGDIGPGQCRAVWVRRTATNSAAVNGETVTLAVQGDTAA